MTAAHRGKVLSTAEFAKLWNDHDMTLSEIGNRLGISAQAVRCRGRARGLPARPQMSGAPIAKRGGGLPPENPGTGDQAHDTRNPT